MAYISEETVREDVANALQMAYALKPSGDVQKFYLSELRLRLLAAMKKLDTARPRPDESQGGLPLPPAKPSP